MSAAEKVGALARRGVARAVDVGAAMVSSQLEVGDPFSGRQATRALGELADDLDTGIEFLKFALDCAGERARETTERATGVVGKVKVSW